MFIKIPLAQWQKRAIVAPAIKSAEPVPPKYFQLMKEPHAIPISTAMRLADFGLFMVGLQSVAVVFCVHCLLPDMLGICCDKGDVKGESVHADCPCIVIAARIARAIRLRSMAIAVAARALEVWCVDSHSRQPYAEGW